MLDSLGVFDEYSMSSPEKTLDFSDWTGNPLESYKIFLSRFKKVLLKGVMEKQVTDVEDKEDMHRRA